MTKPIITVNGVPIEPFNEAKFAKENNINRVAKKNQTAGIMYMPRTDLPLDLNIYCQIKIIKHFASRGFYYDGDYRKTRRKIRNLNKQLLHAVRGDY